MEKEIIVKPSFNIRSSTKGTFYILFKPWYVFFYSFLLLTGSIGFLDYYLNIFPNNDKPNDFPTFGLVIILLPLFLYFSIYRTIKKQINENPRLKEDISYIFNNDFF